MVVNVDKDQKKNHCQNEELKLLPVEIGAGCLKCSAVNHEDAESCEGYHAEKHQRIELPEEPRFNHPVQPFSQQPQWQAAEQQRPVWWLSPSAENMVGSFGP